MEPTWAVIRLRGAPAGQSCQCAHVHVNLPACVFVRAYVRACTSVCMDEASE